MVEWKPDPITRLLYEGPQIDNWYADEFLADDKDVEELIESTRAVSNDDA